MRINVKLMALYLAKHSSTTSLDRSHRRTMWNGRAVSIGFASNGFWSSCSEPNGDQHFCSNWR